MWSRQAGTLAWTRVETVEVRKERVATSDIVCFLEFSWGSSEIKEVDIY